QLVRQTDGKQPTLSAAVDDSGVGTVVTLTFSGTTAVDNGSLADGRYTLTVFSADVSDSSGQLDGNGDGIGGDDYVLPADSTPNPPGPLSGIFRFFGDVTGNGAVDAADFLQFRTDYLLTNVPNSPFDFDNNGTVDAADFLQFRNRYLLTYLT